MAFDFNKGTTITPTTPTSGPATLGGGFDFSKGQTVNNGFPTTVPDTVHKSFLQKLGSVAGTIGNALTSSEQTLGKGLSTVFDQNTQQTVEHSNQQAQSDTNALIQAIHNQPDPTKKQHLVDTLKKVYGADYQAPTAEQINPGFGLTNKQVIGAAGGVALDVLSAGSYGNAAKGAETGKLLTKSDALAGLMEKAGISSTVVPKATKVAETVAPSLSQKLATIGKNTASNVVKSASVGYGYDVTQHLQNGKEGKDIFKPGAGTWTGVALPAAMGAFEAGLAVSKDFAPRIINSLVKPSKSNFAYGKNPGRTISELGITGNSLEDFGNNIGAVKQDVGQKIGGIISNPANANEVINAQDQINKIDQAINEAAKGGKNNQSIVTSLQNIKDALLYEHTVNVDGDIVKATATPMDLSHLNPKQAFQLKQDIAGMTRFTGNPTDDKLVNSTLQNVYGGLKDKINTAVGKNNPEILKLNQQYADLTSAEIAVQHRADIVGRSNLVNPMAVLEGSGGAVAGMIAGGPIGAGIGAISGIALDKALGSVAFKTRVASWLGSESPAVIQKLAPDVKAVLLKVFPKFAAQINQNPNAQ